jgi:hypothetical protein
LFNHLLLYYCLLIRKMLLSRTVKTLKFSLFEQMMNRRRWYMLYRTLSFAIISHESFHIFWLLWLLNYYWSTTGTKCVTIVPPKTCLLQEQNVSQLYHRKHVYYRNKAEQSDIDYQPNNQLMNSNDFEQMFSCNCSGCLCFPLFRCHQSVIDYVR